MPENEAKLVIIEPDGPQGAKLGLNFLNVEQFKRFDEAMGQIDEKERNTVEAARRIARELGIKEIEP